MQCFRKSLVARLGRNGGTWKDCTRYTVGWLRSKRITVHAATQMWECKLTVTKADICLVFQPLFTDILHQLDTLTICQNFPCEHASASVIPFVDVTIVQWCDRINIFVGCFSWKKLHLYQRKGLKWRRHHQQQHHQQQHTRSTACKPHPSTSPRSHPALFECVLGFRILLLRF